MRSPRVFPAGRAPRPGSGAHGLTLIELLTTIIIMGIMLAVAAPGFEAALRRSAIVDEANRLLTDIQYARSEAIKRGSPVNLCRSALAETCTVTDCTCHTGTEAQEWTRGWLLYVASDRDTNFNPDTDVMLKQSHSAAGGIGIRSDGNFNQWLSIGSSGALDEAGPGFIAVCANGESTQAVPGRLISVSLTGRPAITEIPPGGSCTP